MADLPDFLEGAVDLHVHSAPDVDERRFSDIELASEATTQHEQTPGLDFRSVVEADLLAFLVVGPADDQAVVAGTENHEVDVGEVDFDPGVRRPGAERNCGRAESRCGEPGSFHES